MQFLRCFHSWEESFNRIELVRFLFAAQKKEDREVYATYPTAGLLNQTEDKFYGKAQLAAFLPLAHSGSRAWQI